MDLRANSNNKYFWAQNQDEEDEIMLSFNRITTTKVGVLKQKPGTPEFQSPT